MVTPVTPESAFSRGNLKPRALTRVPRPSLMAQGATVIETCLFLDEIARELVQQLQCNGVVSPVGLSDEV